LWTTVLIIWSVRVYNARKIWMTANIEKLDLVRQARISAWGLESISTWQYEMAKKLELGGCVLT